MKKLVSTSMLAMLAGLAQATVLTFDAGLANSNPMPQDYGDNVTSTTMGAYTYGENGEGYTPSVTIEYIGGTGGLHYWHEGFSGTTGVLNNEVDGNPDTTFELTAASGHQVVLHSLLWTSYAGADVPVTFIKVTDQDGTELYNSGSFGTGGTNGIIDVGAITGQTLRVSADLSTAGYANDSFAFDNIVFSEFELPTAPVIAQQPASVYTDPGDLVIFSVQATASSGTLSYAWTKNSAPLTDNEYIAGSTASRLVISPARMTDEGNYQVIVTDVQGMTTSSVAALTLDLPLPSITTQPANLTQSAGTVLFSATVADATSYQWYYGENPITNSSAFGGATTASLQISGATQVNNGIYSVRASNARGTVASKLVRLTITTSTTIGDAIDNDTVLLSNSGGWYNQATYNSDGTDAARSAAIDHNQQSALFATLFGPGEVTFQRWVNSEGSDPLRSYLDDVSFDSIAGTTSPWTEAFRFIPDSAHTLKWEYAKDYSVDTGLDAGFVDQFTFTPYDLSSVENAVDMPPQALTFGGAALWYGQDNETHDGNDAARSPAIGNHGQAWFETTVMGPGRVIFWRKTSCEGSDRLILRVDGTSVYSQSGASEWSAVTNWINWGEHTLRWSYEKDYSVSSLDDAVWVDQISYVPVTRSSLAEAADGPDLAWTTSEDYPWFGQDRFSDDGTDALQSGVAPNHGQSWVTAVANGPGSLSFRWKTLSEGSDGLYFQTNGVSVASISGNTSWATNHINLSNNNGPVELTWSYNKDYSVARLEDAGWIDQVIFTPQRDPVDLTVNSTLGSPTPAVGTDTYDWNTEITCSVADITSGTTQYDCFGWTGTGSIPASGSGNQVTTTLDLDSSITWNWQTNYWLDVNITGGGSVSHTDGWFEKDSVQTLIATPNAGWLFMGWSGDASGTNNAVLTMNTAKTIMANFSDDADNDGLTNAEEAVAGSNPWKSDTDDDGFDDAFEVAKGWNPTIDDSDVADYIGANGDEFGLYPSNAVLEVAVGEMLLETDGDNAMLSLQLEESEDLVTWTNSGDAVIWDRSVGDEKKYFRVRAGQ